VALVSLLFASRNPVFFGVSYSVYTGLNLLAARHLSTELVTVFKASWKRLSSSNSDTREVYEQALRALEAYYVARPNIFRVALTFVLSVVGLAISIYGRVSGRRYLDAVSYGVYVTSVLVLELILIFWWRQSLYQSLRPLNAALYEKGRAKNRSH